MKTSPRSPARCAAGATALVSVLTFTTQIAWAACTKDTDCKGDRVCESGVCVTPPSAPPVAPGPSSGTESTPPGPPVTTSAPPAEPSTATPPATEPAPPPVAPQPAGPPVPSPPPPEEATVALTVSAAHNEPYRVSFTSHDGKRSESCTTPCTLQVKPGFGTLDVSGPRNYQQDLVVERGGTGVRLKTSCPSCFAWSGVSLAAAAGLTWLTVVAINDVPNCDPYSGSDLVQCNHDTTKFILYSSFLGAGALTFAALSISVLVDGASRGRTRAVVEGPRGEERCATVHRSSPRSRARRWGSRGAAVRVLVSSAPPSSDGVRPGSGPRRPPDPSLHRT